MRKRGILFFLLLFVWNAAVLFTGRFVALPETLLPVLNYLLPLVLWLALRHEQPQLLNGELDGVNTGLIIILSIAAQPFLLLIVTAVSSLNPYHFPHTFLPGSNVLPLLTRAAIPAFCVEVVFRGYLLTFFPKQKQAVIVSGLLIGVFQMSVWGFPYAFVTGVMYAFVTVCARSVRAGALLHFCVNAAQITGGLISAYRRGLVTQAPVAVPSISERMPALTLGQLRLVLTFSVASLIFLPVIVVIIRVFIAHNKQRQFESDITGM